MSFILNYFFILLYFGVFILIILFFLNTLYWEEIMNCNNANDGFEEARKIIAQAQLTRPNYGCCSFPVPSSVTGPTGPTGPAGEDGVSPTVTVGTTLTGDPGTEASVTNSGTETDVILDFVIPEGIAGETPNLTIGTVTTGNPGTEAAATITGTAPNFVLNLTIPQGPTGPAA